MGAAAVRAGSAFVEIGADPRKLFAALNKINKQVGSLGSSMTSLGTRITGIGAAMAAPLALASRQFMAFDDAIRMTGAVSGASGAALQKLNETARELGATTSFTAVQVATLMTELGRAGFKPDEINAMTGAVLDLARATGTDAALSAGIMAASLRQFSLGAGEAARVADVLTKAANSTFNTVEGLGESLKYAGPVAKSLGMSLEDTVAVLGVLGNVGIQGSEAGTALRRLSVIAAGAGKELKDLFGVDNTDAAGNLKPLVDILDEINKVTAGMPVAERTAKMAKAFGLLGITSANVLSASASGVRGLAEELRNSQGTAARTAKEMDAGLGGAMRIAMSAIEGTALAIGDALAPSLQGILESVTAVAGGLTKFIASNQELIVSFGKNLAIFTAVGGSLIGLGTALQLVSFGMGGLIKTASLVVAPLVAIVSTTAGLAASFVAAVPAVAGLAVSLSATMGTAAASVATQMTSAASSTARFVLYAAGAFSGLASSMAMSVAPAMTFVGKGLSAVAADAARLASPLTAVFTQAGSAVAGFASRSAASISAYVSSLVASAAATVSSMATIAGAWLGNAYVAVVTFATGAAAKVGAYIAVAYTAAAATVANATKIAVAWAASAMPATTAFAVNAATQMGAYIASTVAATAATVANATKIAVAWVASGMPGIMAFVVGATGAIGLYLASCAAVVAGSVASAAAVAAAWLAPAAPILAMGAVLAGVVGLAYAFGGSITSALSGIGDLAGQAGAAIGGAFTGVISDATVVFKDLYSVATTTFGGIYQAIADGDLQGAMDIAMAGLYAAWARGSEAIMGSVDSWAAFIQNTVTYMWAGVKGVFGESINWVLNAFDDMVAAVQKSWNYVQSFIKKGFDLEKENRKVTDANAARKRERAAARGMDKEMAAADATAAERYAANDRRAAERGKATEAANADLNKKARGASERRVQNDQFAQLLKDIEAATTLDQLRDAYGEFDALSSNGRLTSQQAATLEVALEDAQQRITQESGAAAGGAAAAAAGPAAGDVAAGAGAAGADAAENRGDSAGTFSAAAAGAMGVGSSIPQKQLETLQRIEQNTRVGDDGAVGE